MFCPSCGSDLANGARFCIHCGVGQPQIQGHQPTTIGRGPASTRIGWNVLGYVYVVALGVTALIQAEKTPSAPSTGLFVASSLWVLLLLATAAAILLKHTQAIVLYCLVATVGAMRVILHGIIPFELLAWIIFNIPAVLYFRFGHSNPAR